MKKILYILLVGAALLVPSEKSDIGKLQPVEAVALYMQEDSVVIETDTGDVGRGADVSGALENLKQTTPGIVYLDTADYLLVSDEALGMIENVAVYLKDSVKVCVDNEQADLMDAAAYLSVHEPEITIRLWRQGTQLQILKTESGRFTLEPAKKS